MMNKKLFMILSIAALFTCFGVMPAQAIQAIPTVSLNVLDSYIEVSESFDVEVWVGGSAIGEDLLGFGLDVTTAGTYFSYDGYAIESGFFDVSDPWNPNNVSGAGVAFTDDVLLATLSFTGLTAGMDSLQTVGAYDGLFYGLFYEFSGYDIDVATNITINPAAPIPEPATMLLLGTGLAGLAGLGRKKFGKR